MKEIFLQFELFGTNITLRWFQVMAALGFLAALHLYKKRAINYREDPERMEMALFYSMMGAILGARLLFVVRNWEEKFAMRSFWKVFDFSEGGFDKAYALWRSAADAFLLAYAPIVERRNGITWGERERDFQIYRRGRYVEFNLVYDRGTLFGLQSGGRTESILMSLPPRVAWRYDFKPQPGSPEESLTQDFLKPRDWLVEETTPNPA